MSDKPSNEARARVAKAVAWAKTKEGKRVTKEVLTKMVTNVNRVIETRRQDEV